MLQSSLPSCSVSQSRLGLNQVLHRKQCKKRKHVHARLKYKQKRCIEVCACICVQVYVCMYMYACICMHACVHACMYACMYGCMHGVGAYILHTCAPGATLHHCTLRLHAMARIRGPHPHFRVPFGRSLTRTHTGCMMLQRTSCLHGVRCTCRLIRSA